MGFYLTCYLAVVNIIAFAMYGIDKQKAKKQKWRISEATLLLAAVAGGSAGAWFGMKMFRHKTKHPKFAYGVPAILVVQAVLLMYFFF